MKIIIYSLLFLILCQGLYAQGLDHEFDRTLQAQSWEVNDKKSEDVKIEMGETEKQVSRDVSHQEIRHRSSPMSVRIRVLPKELKDTLQTLNLKLAYTNEVSERETNNALDVQRKYNHFEAELNSKQKLGVVSLREALSFHYFDRNNGRSSGTRSEDFVGGEVALDVRSWDFFCTPEGCKAIGYHVGASYEQDRDFVPQVDPNLHDVDQYTVRADLVSPRWFLESVYQNQYLDHEDDYYETKNTVALHWNLGNESDDFGTWIVVTGLQHVKTNLNPKELLGFLLSLKRKLTPTHNGVEVTFFMDPTGGSASDNPMDAWTAAVKGDMGPFVIEYFAQSLEGEWGEDRSLGMQAYVKWDF